MDLSNTETMFYSGRCKCCLNEGDLKNMWMPYTSKGETEIYGMMLTECFVLPWQQPESHMEMICNTCISRLRDSLAFRREVLVSEEVLREHQSEIFVCTTVKVEHDLDQEKETDFEDEYLEIDEGLTVKDLSNEEYAINKEEQNEEPLLHEQSLIPKKSIAEKRKRKCPEKLPKEDRNRTYKQYTSKDLRKAVEAVANDEMSGRAASKVYRVPRKVLSAKLQSGVIKKEELSNTLKDERVRDQDDESYFDAIEYLEIDVGMSKVESNEENTLNESSQKPEEGTEELPRKRKWPKKLSRQDRNKTYKQYTVKDMKLAIEAVVNNNMSCNAAAEIYGVPRKTLAVKLQTRKEEVDDEAEKFVDQEKHYKLVEEIKTILTYTNAIPYKVRTSRYYCAYCTTDGPQFEDPDDLRAHTKTEHVDDRTEGVEHIMRPQWMNEVVKLDIYNLHCTVCSTILPAWNNMFSHLEEVHNVILEEAYNRAIPYTLTRELNCALCGDSFLTYNNLDGHMNTHYSSYICYECGDTFLSASRLNKHTEVHNTGKHPCEVCGKVFKLEKYKRKHVDFVHGRKEKVKCLYCTEKFYGLLQRHQHVLEQHKEKVKIMTCEMCGKTFDWKPYYAAHLKRRHSMEKNFKCKECDMTFLMRYELKSHEVTHTNEKNYVCEICNERFKRRISLIRHCQTHHDLQPPKASNKTNKSVSEA